MNPLATFRELWNNREYLRAFDGGEYKIWEVHTDRVWFRGRKLTEWGRFGKQKLENLLVLSEPHQKIKVKYL